MYHSSCQQSQVALYIANIPDAEVIKYILIGHGIERYVCELDTSLFKLQMVWTSYALG